MTSRVVAEGAVSIPYAGADELLTPGEAGDYLTTGERFIRRLIAERRIDYVKLGRYVRVQRSVLDAFIDSGRIPRAPVTVDRPNAPPFEIRVVDENDRQSRDGEVGAGDYGDTRHARARLAHAEAARTHWRRSHQHRDQLQSAPVVQLVDEDTYRLPGRMRLCVGQMVAASVSSASIRRARSSTACPACSAPRTLPVDLDAVGGVRSRRKC
jgi:excisionase family DNA binding protein